MELTKITQRRTTAAAGASLLALSLALTACNTGTANETAATSDHDETVAHTHEISNEVPTVDLIGYLDAYDESNDNVEITYDDANIYIKGNGVPDFDTGDFPNQGNPNTISEQDIAVAVPRTPVYTGEATPAREPGMTLASIKFEPGTAERDPETGTPIEAIQDVLDLGLDFNNAHVQPNGQYHFHADPVPLSESDGTEHSSLVGFMLDGFPVYAKYGYGATEQVDGTVKEITSSWQLKTGQRAESEPAGTYDGTYTTDYEFVEGSGDLDQCNGMFTKTPEFPDGTYSYFVTSEFPYVSRCLNGEFTEPERSGPPAGGAAGAQQPQNGQAGGQNGAQRPQDGTGAGTQGQGRPADAPDLAAAAEQLGVSQDELRQALGTPPPDLQAAAKSLGVSLSDLESALGIQQR
jgi:hypothetical protein